MKSIAGAIVVAIIIVVVFSSRVRAETNRFFFRTTIVRLPARARRPQPPRRRPAPPSPRRRPMPRDDDGQEMAPPLRVAAALRPAVGLGTNVELYGGATLFQDGTLHVTDSRAPGADSACRPKARSAPSPASAGLHLAELRRDRGRPRQDLRARAGGTGPRRRLLLDRLPLQGAGQRVNHNQRGHHRLLRRRPQIRRQHLHLLRRAALSLQPRRVPALRGLRLRRHLHRRGPRAPRRQHPGRGLGRPAKAPTSRAHPTISTSRRRVWPASSSSSTRTGR